MNFSKLSSHKIRKIVGVFSKDYKCQHSGELLQLNRNTINRYYNLFREALFKESLTVLEKELGIFEALQKED